MKIPLFRPYQEKGLQLLRKAFLDGKTAIILACHRWGKVCYLFKYHWKFNQKQQVCLPCSKKKTTCNADKRTFHEGRKMDLALNFIVTLVCFFWILIYALFSPIIGGVYAIKKRFI